MPAIHEPTMHEMLWEWVAAQGYRVSGEVTIGNGRIDLVAYSEADDEYVGIEVKDESNEVAQQEVASAIPGVGEGKIQSREQHDWTDHWEQLYRYQTSGYLDKLYLASQRPEYIFDHVQHHWKQRDAEQPDRVAELYSNSDVRQSDLGSIRIPGPHQSDAFEIVREADQLQRTQEPSLSTTNERWVQHHIWREFDGIREGVLPNYEGAHFRRIDVAAFTGSDDPTEVYANQEANDIIGVEAKGRNAVRNSPSRVQQQLIDYVNTGALTRVNLAVPDTDREPAVSLLRDTASDDQAVLDNVGLYTVDQAGAVTHVWQSEKLTLRYDGIHTKEDYVTDIIWGYGSEEWDREKQYQSVFEMRS
ncbi:hypothetical protein [Halorubrum ezzemoulense]|uniref:hypothetical protein n=1 Tax=Halorubrum ezzemoulense TaxID=337243 RepID=UPI00232D80B3|nr:hypothetical protein [Halorubrum ezzemoulense]MDB2247401.1 hypothetical protein [Halorubrum ezzemoulense]